MQLEVNPFKALTLFAPLWLLLGLSLWVHTDAWRGKPILLAILALLPLAGAGLAALFGPRWRLELTPDALIHHTLTRAEVFEWARMGPLVIKRSPALDLVVVRTFWFEYPLDEPRTLEQRAAKLTGRRILCIFGDRSASKIVEEIEAWRALYARR